MLRPLRVLRVFTATQALFTRSGGLLRRGQAIGLTALLLDAERGAPGANIETPGEALWWAATTVTTVGYGDVYPVTTTGRIVAVASMVVGIALIGSVTATVAAWFVGQGRQAESDIDKLVDEVAAFRSEVARLTDAVDGRVPQPDSRMSWPRPASGEPGSRPLSTG